MADRIRGSFPGGPSRTGPSARSDHPPRTHRMDDLERADAERRFRATRAGRRRKRLVGLLVSLLVAGAVGWGLGLGAHQSAEEITESAREQEVQDLDISREVNRTLLELWRMEEIEAQRGQRIR